MGTDNQLIIERSMIEEIKTYHQQLAVVFYDYKKVYDIVHHAWIFQVYK